MNALSFKIQEYHAIKSAEVAIDGITVVAGENGSGKSTLAKWFYFVINGINHFDFDVWSELCATYNVEIDRIRRIVPVRKISEFDTPFRAPKDNSNPEILISQFESSINVIKNRIFEYLPQISNTQQQRIADFLQIKYSEGGCEPAFENFFVSIKKRFLNDFNRCQRIIENRKRVDLFHNIENRYRPYGDAPHKMQLTESGVKVFERTVFNDIFSVRKAIYVDTSMSFLPIKRNSESDVIADDLFRMMSKPTLAKSDDLKKIIQGLLAGEVVYSENVFNQEFKFVREDGLEIPLSSAATGIKSLAILFRLIETGALDNETVLLIDEPETHLHPQWIVEYARLLVLINKSIGTKILIATHNPDMVSALRYISEKEGSLPHLRYYLAEKQNNYQYTYKDKKDNIEPIFESFNIALDRINQYGI